MSLRIGGQLVSPLSSIDRGGDVVGTFVNTTSDAVLDIVDIIYPIGSIYLSVNSANPSSLFGGTWVQIKDTFLLSAGDTYSGGDTGGEASVKLAFENYMSYAWNAGANMPSTDVNTAFNGGSELGIQIKYSDNINVPHNNMPPYLVVYVWKRTA